MKIIQFCVHDLIETVFPVKNQIGVHIDINEPVFSE